MKKATPLPTEAAILDFIRASPGSVGKREIARAFKLSGATKVALKHLMKEMERRGQLDRRKKSVSAAGVLAAVTAIEIIGIDDDGDLFGVPAEWNGDTPPRILVRTANEKPLKPGDQVLARVEALTEIDRYPYAAKPIKNLSGQSGRVLGVLRKSRNGATLLSIDKKAKRDLEVLTSSIGDALDGELVSAEILRGRGRSHAVARIRTRHGDVSDARNVSLIAIHQHGIPNHFPQRVLEEAETLSTFASTGREDFRRLPLITIDPADARDHDDAVHARPDDDPENQGGHVVTVAIADVAAYIRPQSALDNEARIRGNSTYFPDRVVPMLPERISNDLCSLREGEERPALAVVMVFDKHGQKMRHKFHRIIMRSAAKLSYEDAQAAIDGKNTVSAALLETVLTPLWNAYAAVSKARVKRSPLELDLPERRLKIDAEGRVVGVYVPARLDAHRLIEEFMIQANVAAAEQLEKRRTPLLYRMHEEPSKEKIRQLISFLKSMSLSFAAGQVLSTRHFNRLLAAAKDHESEQAVHDIVLRTQAQATYSPDNLGHFGLSLQRYAHFTSPIRRYPDLIVHRALISALQLGDDGLSEQDRTNLAMIAEMASTAERRSAIAERDTVDRMVSAYLASYIGATFTGRISGVVGAGLFVKLQDTGADGFVPVSSLGSEYYTYDETKHALTSALSGSFQLGDTVQVRLLEAAPIKGGLRFAMVSDGKKPAKRSKTSR